MFNNLLYLKRIAEEIELDIIRTLYRNNGNSKNSSFIAKKAKTYEEGKKCSQTKVPIDDISINDLINNQTKSLKMNNNKKKFNYIIKIADFYFKDTAKKMVTDRIKKETTN